MPGISGLGRDLGEFYFHKPVILYVVITGVVGFLVCCHASLLFLPGSIWIVVSKSKL